MLKDAALLQLDLLLAALEHDLILKDSSLYNVQFTGARALFIDVGSFERLREDELWVGYRSSSSKGPQQDKVHARRSRNTMRCKAPLPTKVRNLIRGGR